MNTENLVSCVKILNEWLAQQPHLPKDIPEILLQKCLISANNSIEIAKNILDLFFTIRSRSPEIFSNRDIDDPEILDNFEILDMIYLDTMVDNCKVFVIRLNSDNVNKYTCLGSIKLFSMVIDLQLLVNNQLSEAEIVVIDLEKSSLKMLKKFSLILIKKITDFIQDARPINMRQIHFIRTQPFVEKILQFIRPVVKAELMKVINLHQSMDDLFKYVPKEVLPKDFGGTHEKTISEYKSELKVNLSTYKTLINEEKFRTVDESKRPVGNPFGDKYGVQGSFRTLDID